MITLELDQTRAAASEQLSPAIVQTIEQELNTRVAPEDTGNIAISYVSDHEIQRLNRMYRDKDSVTDVLSFSYLDDPGRHENIGDVVIALDQAKRQATDEDLELELVDLIVHGTLHVLGFDHEVPEEAKEMFSLQDAIVAHVL